MRIDCRVGLNDERNTQLRERRAIFLENIHIDDIICFFREEEWGFSKKDDGGLMITSAETQCNTQRLNRSMRLCGIFSYHDSNTLCHLITRGYVNARKRSQPSIIPESTTRPDSDIRESTSWVETPCCWHP